MKIIIGASFFALCAGAAVYYQYEIQPPPSQFGVGLDNSLSMRPDCDGLARQAQAAMSKASGARAGSMLTLLTIGTSAGNPAPTRAFEEALPASSGSIMARAEGGDDDKLKGFFNGFQKACEAASASPSSPVIRLVSDGVAELQSKAASPKARKFLIVQSDLMDDAEPAMRAALIRARKYPDTPVPPALARSINNEATSVVFCGVSQTATGQKGARPLPGAVLQRIYRELFTRPEQISFRPYCGA